MVDSIICHTLVLGAVIMETIPNIQNVIDILSYMQKWGMKYIFTCASFEQLMIIAGIIVSAWVISNKSSSWMGRKFQAWSDRNLYLISSRI